MYNQNKKPKPRYSKRKLILVSLGLLIVFGALATVLEATNTINLIKPKDEINTTEVTTPEPDEIAPDTTNNDSKPTESEATQNSDNLDSTKETSTKNSTPSSASSKTAVTPVITSASKNGQVFAYVSGVIESGGTCSFVFTGPKTITIATKGVPDANTTNCRQPTSDTHFSNGSWKVVLEYNSAKAQGKSSAVTLY